MTVASPAAGLPPRSKEAQNGIDSMPAVLRWPRWEPLRTIHDGYLDFVADRIGSCLLPADPTTEPVTDELLAGLWSLPEQEFLRVVLAPTTTALLFSGRCRREALATWLRHATLVEQARLGRSQRVGACDPVTAGARSEPLGAPLWSAVGDTVLLPDGTVERGPHIEGFPPIDSGSPHALSGDVDDDGPGTARSALTASVLAAVLDKLRRTRDGILASSPVIAEFVNVYTKVLILQARAGGAFSSGSTGLYIGRSVLANPQGNNVDDVELADAVVHEAIHSLLYMLEVQTPWVVDQSLYRPVPMIPSPWTGTVLPVRPYLQACFVWYGLLHFWSAALEAGAFEPAAALVRFRQAAQGFQVGGLLGGITQTCPGGVAPAVAAAIDAMENAVTSEWRAL